MALNANAEARDKAKRLYQFIRGLIELRRVPVRSYRNYELVVPLDDLPDAPHCRFAARGDFAEEEETWLEVQCPKIEPYPEPPGILLEWLSPSELGDASLDMPNLLRGETVRSEDESSEDFVEADNAGLPSSAPEPPQEIKEAWENYVQTQWWPWRERVAPKYKAKKLYEDLFLMYQRQLHLGETYEVVIGLGLLSWRPSEAVEIQRHLVTVNLSLELNPMGQIISLEPTASGIELRLEEDILEPTQRPPAHIRDRVKNGLREISTQALTSNTVHELLREYVHALSPEARYDESFALPKDLSHTPLVTFSPCLILRKRGGEGILGMVEAIIQHIERGGDIPPAVLRQVSIIEEVEEAETSSQDRLLCDDDGNETYFPLPANREQQDVLRHLSKAHGTVLEGPPGTGKSLTIANLICHLLATGKRVLVTSHTARALQVVRGWIPDPIKPLCVQALSNDAAGMQELEFSVKGITDRYLKYKHEDSRHEVERLTKELHNAREKLQQALKEQRSIREKEVHRHDKIAGVYSGTAAEIARLLKSEEDEVGFIKDDINLDQNAPCSAEDFRSLLSSLVSYTDPVGCGGGGEFPDLNDIPKPHEYEALIVELGRLEKQAELHSEDTHVFTEKLRGLPLDQRKSLASQIRAMANDVEALRARRTESWFDRAFYDIFTEKDRIWRGRLRDLQESVKKLRAIPRDDVLAQVTGLESIDPNELQRRVKVLQDFLAERKTDRFGIRWLLPKNVRAALDFISGVHIDGEPCSERRLLDRLWNHAEALCLLAKLDREWASLEKCNEESLARKIDWYEDVWERLAEILNLYEKAKEVWRVCAECGDRGPAWQDETDVLEYLNALERVEVFDRFKDKQAEVRALVTLIERKVEKFPDLQCLKNLKEAMTQRHKDQYREAWVQLNRTREQLECRARAGATLDTLSRVAPSLVEELRRDPSSPRWDDLVRNWDRAWAWARARTWLAHLTDPEADQRATEAVRNEQSRIQELLAQLASERAWACCFDRMTERQRVELQAWANQVKRIGRGKGKYANQHRQEARKHLAECQSAIPAWIMPMYRVAESMRPGSTRFDIAIIDEASQSGPEALVLLFLADRILVVGDDKQISPDPFTRVEDVNRLRAELISDLPAYDVFDPENSLFDLAKIRYPARVRLVEHFRCMPEIIQFSNELCYANDPLLPLRQFGAGRLEPVVNSVYVQKGYTRGRQQKTNPPEAIHIARKIAELIKLEKYKGKTFGVISLLGQRQASLIETELLNLVGAKELQERRIICGDAYDFQGDERDVMFLSLVVAPSQDSRIRALSDPKGRDQRRYNVAMSRAKDQVWLFHSVTLDDLNPSDLRAKLLSYCQNPKRKEQKMAGIDVEEARSRARKASRSQERPPGPFDSWFELDVFLKLVDKGYYVIPQYEVSGYRIDLAVVGHKAKLAIECDGDQWHGPEQWDKDAAR